MSAAARWPFSLLLSEAYKSIRQPTFPPPPFLCFQLIQMISTGNPMGQSIHLHISILCPIRPWLAHASIALVKTLLIAAPVTHPSSTTSARGPSWQCAAQECNNTLNDCSGSSHPFQPIKKQQLLGQALLTTQTGMKLLSVRKALWGMVGWGWRGSCFIDYVVFVRYYCAIIKRMIISCTLWSAGLKCQCYVSSSLLDIRSCKSVVFIFTQLSVSVCLINIKRM